MKCRLVCQINNDLKKFIQKKAHQIKKKKKPTLHSADAGAKANKQSSLLNVNLQPNNSYSFPPSFVSFTLNNDSIVGRISRDDVEPVWLV